MSAEQAAAAHVIVFGVVRPGKTALISEIVQGLRDAERIAFHHDSLPEFKTKPTQPEGDTHVR